MNRQLSLIRGGLYVLWVVGAALAEGQEVTTLSELPSAERSAPGVAEQRAHPSRSGIQCTKGRGKLDAEQVLRKVANSYAAADSYEMQYTRTIYTEVGGVKQTHVCEMSVCVQRPNRVAVRVKDDGQGIAIVSDGQALHLRSEKNGQITKLVSPKTFDDLLLNADFVTWNGKATDGPLLELLATNPYDKLMDGGKATTCYVGTERIDGRRTHHLHFVGQLDWDLWVAVDGDPVVCQFAIDYANALANGNAPSELLSDLKLTVVHRYKNWKFGIVPAPDAFKLPPPARRKTVRQALETRLRELRQNAAKSHGEVRKTFEGLIEFYEDQLKKLPLDPTAT